MLVMLGVGVTVAVVAIGMYLPIFNMVKVVNAHSRPMRPLPEQSVRAEVAQLRLRRLPTGGAARAQVKRRRNLGACRGSLAPFGLQPCFAALTLRCGTPPAVVGRASRRRLRNRAGRGRRAALPADEPTCGCDWRPEPRKAELTGTRRTPEPLGCLSSARLPR